MDLCDIDPYLFLYSVVISLDISERLLSRLNGLRGLDVSSVLLSVSVIEVLLLELAVLLIGTVLIILAVLVVPAVLVATLGTIAVILPVGIISAAVSVTVPVSVRITVLTVAAVITVVISAVIRSRFVVILSHQRTPLINQNRLYHIGILIAFNALVIGNRAVIKS